MAAVLIDAILDEHIFNIRFYCFMCRIVTDGEKREIWRLTVENVSTAMKPEEEEREHNMYKDVSSSPHVLQVQSRDEKYGF